MLKHQTWILKRTAYCYKLFFATSSSIPFQLITCVTNYQKGQVSISAWAVQMFMVLKHIEQLTINTMYIVVEIFGKEISVRIHFFASDFTANSKFCVKIAQHFVTG